MATYSFKICTVVEMPYINYQLGYVAISHEAKMVFIQTPQKGIVTSSGHVWGKITSSEVICDINRMMEGFDGVEQESFEFDIKTAIQAVLAVENN